MCGGEETGFFLEEAQGFQGWRTEGLAENIFYPCENRKTHKYVDKQEPQEMALTRYGDEHSETQRSLIHYSRIKLHRTVSLTSVCGCRSGHGLRGKPCLSPRGSAEVITRSATPGSMPLLFSGVKFPRKFTDIAILNVKARSNLSFYRFSKIFSLYWWENWDLEKRSDC